SKELKSWGLLLFLACVWGSSFILMKRGMYTVDGLPIFSDLQVGAMRMLIAGLVLAPFAVRHVKKIKTWQQFISLSIVGFSGNFFPAFLFTYAETGLSSGFAGMLNSFTPIFTIIIGFFVFKVKLSSIQLLGIAIGTTGIVLLMFAGKSISMTGTWFHILAIVLATLMYGISLNTIKHTLQMFKAIEITSLAFFIVLIPAAIANLTFGTALTFQQNPHALEGLGYITILSVVGTALAVILFNKIISISSALFASSVTYFIPIVAVLIGLYFGEQISWGQVGSMCIVLLGVFILNSGNILKLSSKENVTE
ncbi:MAG: DMT family transporter, partial [Flavobacteriales bacterium]